MLPRITTKAEAVALFGLLTLALLIAAGALAGLSLALVSGAEAGGRAMPLRDFAMLMLSALSLLVFAPFSAFVSVSLLKAHDLAEHVRTVAETDQLTGLPNRSATMKRLSAAVAMAKEKGQNGVLLFVDLDHFKSINDTYGHAGGDSALAHAAAIMRQLMPKDMVMGRFGGEEFVCFGANAAETVANAFALVVALRATPAEYDGKQIRVTASIGLAMMDETSTVETLLANADEALYLAKSAGRNRMVHHEDIALAGAKGAPKPPAPESQTGDRRRLRAA